MAIKKIIGVTIEYIDEYQKQTDLVWKIINIKKISTCCKIIEDQLGIIFEEMDELYKLSRESNNVTPLEDIDPEVLDSIIKEDLTLLRSELQVIQDSIYTLGI